MKKIILILFLFLSCYLIYNLTEDKTLTYVVIGDVIADNPYTKKNITKYNNNYINPDYRIKDLINIIQYNEELTIDNKKQSIHRMLKNADILIVSIGMNDIYYKLNTDTNQIYTYINEMIKETDILLNKIKKYDYQKVLFLGYYNINDSHNDIFTYLNYKAKKIVEKYNYEYIDLNKKMRNKPDLYQNREYFAPNSQGYSEINKIIVEKIKKY